MRYSDGAYLTVSSSGSVFGRMAYKSTLKKYGNSADRYMYMNGYFSGNNLYLTLDGGEESWERAAFAIQAPEGGGVVCGRTEERRHVLHV